VSLITEATLRDYFETFGEIQQIVIRKHELTEDGRQHGFAFITYREHEINEQVIEMVRKLLVGDILYDCAWSKQYMDFMRKDTNGQQASNASIATESMFKGSHASTPIGVSRAGSLDFYDQGSVSTDAMLRNSFYGTGTPSSLSIDAYEGSIDNRWVVPANSHDQSSVDTMGRRSETPGQGDIPGGIAFTKLSVSPSPGSISLAPSFDRQDHGQHQSYPSASLTIRNTPASSQQQPSNMGGSNRVSAVNARQGVGHSGMEHANARLSGMKKQYSAPQSSLDQTQRRVMDFAPQAGGFPISSWSADMMDDYSSSRRLSVQGSPFLTADVNVNGANSMIQGTDNNQKKISDTGHLVSRNFTHSNLSVQHQQQVHNAFPPQHPHAAHQIPSQAAHSSNRPLPGMGNNFGNSSNMNNNVNINVGPNGAVQNQFFHLANMSPQQTPTHSYQNLNNYSPAISHTSGPSTAATSTGYGQHEIRAFSPHYGNSHVQSSPYSLANRMEEMMQKPVAHLSPYLTSKSNTVMQQSSTNSTHHDSASLSHDELDDRRTFFLHSNTYNKTQQAQATFPQFSPMTSSPDLLLGVPRTQSDSAIADSSVYYGNEYVLSGNPNNGILQKRSWLLSPSMHQQIQYGSLPPRANATQVSENMKQSLMNHKIHPAQQYNQHAQISAGAVPGIRSYSGSDPVSLNNSYQNSLDEYDNSHGVPAPLNLTAFSNKLDNGANLGPYSLQNHQMPGGYSAAQTSYPLTAAADSLQMTNLELAFLTASLDTPAGGAPSAVSSASTMNTPAGQAQRRMEEFYDDLLASNSFPKDSESGCNSANPHQLSTTPLFSLSESSSPRLEGSQTPSFSSFSIDRSRKGIPNIHGHSSLLVDDGDRDSNYSYLSRSKPAIMFPTSKDAGKGM
jgi:hypothetical protein